MTHKTGLSFAKDNGKDIGKEERLVRERNESESELAFSMFTSGLGGEYGS